MAFIAQHDTHLLQTTPLLAILDPVLPHATVQGIVARYAPPGARCRKLPGEVGLALLIALSLVPMTAAESVLAFLLTGLRLRWPSLQPRVASKSGISRARRRWGTRPIIALFRTVCQPLATPQDPGAFRFGLHVMAIDSTLEDLADTPANEQAFGRHHGSHGAAAFPAMLGIYLLECGTRAIWGAGFWPCHTSVHAGPAQRLLRALRPGMLLLWDAGFHSYPLSALVRERGAHLLGRVPAGQTFVPERLLPDGSLLARFSAAPPSRRTAATPFLLVRVVTYTLVGAPKVYRLLTTLLDPAQAPALELILAYHERWEIETVIDELDTHLRLAPGPFRSPTPRGVLQEAYGLLLAHYAVRATMLAAARQAGCDPDRVSFVHTVRLLVPLLALAPLLTAAGLAQALSLLLADLVRPLLPAPAHRSNPRVVRRNRSKHRVRSTRTAAARTNLPPFREQIAITCPSGLSP